MRRSAKGAFGLLVVCSALGAVAACSDLLGITPFTAAGGDGGEPPTSDGEPPTSDGSSSSGSDPRLEGGSGSSGGSDSGSDAPADAPDDRAADAPDDRAADAPDDRTADAPDDRTADAPDDRTADAPDDWAADAQDAAADTLVADSGSDGTPCVTSFVQSAQAQGSSTTTISAKFAGAQAAGDLAVVGIWWVSSSPAVTSLVDTSGNTYDLGVHEADNGTTDGDLWVYYAKGIKAADAGANSVTVTMSNVPTMQWAALALAEYAGPTALDVAAGSFSLGTSAPTVNLTTTGACEVVVGWATSNSGQSGPGPTFTLRQDPQYVAFEDRLAVPAGTLGVSTSPSDATWVIAAAAFR
jgi:hypothetical protein